MPFVKGQPPTAGSWKKGRSANPGGRSKDLLSLIESARKSCPAALARAKELLDDEDGRVAIAAASLLLDRGMGKPQPIPLDLAQVSDEALIAEVRRRAEVRQRAEDEQRAARGGADA